MYVCTEYYVLLVIGVDKYQIQCSAFFKWLESAFFMQHCNLKSFLINAVSKKYDNICLQNVVSDEVWRTRSWKYSSKVKSSSRLYLKYSTWVNVFSYSQSLYSSIVFKLSHNYDKLLSIEMEVYMLYIDCMYNFSFDSTFTLFHTVNADCCCCS